MYIYALVHFYHLSSLKFFNLCLGCEWLLFIFWFWENILRITWGFRVLHKNENGGDWTTKQKNYLTTNMEPRDWHKSWKNMQHQHNAMISSVGDKKYGRQTITLLHKDGCTQIIYQTSSWEEDLKRKERTPS